VALGVGLVVAPGLAARTWFGEDDASTRLLLRSIGARDVALGAGLLRSDDARPWLTAGIVADAVDAVASLRAAGDVPAAKLLPGTALAALFVGLGALERQRAAARPVTRTADR
jgi:hypothetical protein